MEPSNLWRSYARSRCGVGVAREPVLLGAGAVCGRGLPAGRQLRHLHRSLWVRRRNQRRGRDGDLDIVALGAIDGSVGLFENDGNGYFVNRSALSGIAPNSTYDSVALGDYDNDGDLDLFLGTDGADALYRNDGNFNFVDVTAASLIVTSGDTEGSTWGDFDGDGWLDLYVAFSPSIRRRRTCCSGIWVTARSRKSGASSRWETRGTRSKRPSSTTIAMETSTSFG